MIFSHLKRKAVRVIQYQGTDVGSVIFYGILNSWVLGVVYWVEGSAEDYLIK